MTGVGREENRETSMNISPEGGTVVVSRKKKEEERGWVRLNQRITFLKRGDVGFVYRMNIYGGGGDVRRCGARKNETETKKNRKSEVISVVVRILTR